MTGFWLGCVRARTRLVSLEQNLLISIARFVQTAGSAVLEHGKATSN